MIIDNRRIGARLMAIATLVGVVETQACDNPNQPDIRRDTVSATPAVIYVRAPDFLWVGETASVGAIVQNQRGSRITVPVRWASRSPDVVGVDSLTGMVTAISAGSAYIVASAGPISASASVTVTIPRDPNLGGISKLISGTSTPMQATAVDAVTGDARTLTGTWSSTSPTVASVNDAGVVTGHVSGSAVISLASAVGPLTMTVTVVSLGGQIVFDRTFGTPHIERVTLDDSVPTVLAGNQERSSPSMARNGTRLAAQCAGRLCFTDDDGRSWTMFPIPGEDPGLSDDGGRITYFTPWASGHDLIIVSPGADTRRIPVLYGDHARPSPDGRQVLFGCDFYDSYDANVCRIDENGRMSVVRDFGYVAEWSPDGLQIACFGERGVTVRTLATGAESVIFPRIFGPGAELAWSPDGKYLAVLLGGVIWIMEADGSNPVQLSRAPGGTVAHISWAKRPGGP